MASARLARTGVPFKTHMNNLPQTCQMNLMNIGSFLAMSFFILF